MVSYSHLPLPMPLQHCKKTRVVSLATSVAIRKHIKKSLFLGVIMLASMGTLGDKQEDTLVTSINMASHL